MTAPGPVHRGSQVTLKTVFTVGFGVLAMAALVVFVLKTQKSLMLTLVAAMLAVALNHAVEALTRRGLRRRLAVPAVIIALVGLVAGLFVVLIPPLVAQAKAFIAQAPVLWEKFQRTPLFLSLDARFDLSEQLRQATSTATGAVAPVLGAISGVLSAAAGLLTLLLLAIFMVIFSPDLLAALLAEFSERNRA